MPLKRYETWYAQSGILVRPNQLQIEVDEPTAANTGVQPFYASSLDDVNVAHTIFTTDDEVIEGYNFLGRIESRADNVTVRNCNIRGQNSTPGDGSGLVNTHHSLNTNFKIQWCDIWPQYPHWNWDSGIVGHDMLVEFCHIRQCTDGINVFNNNIASPLLNPYPTNTIIRQNLIEDVVFWTAQTNAVVHPGDVITHNDIIQHQGGMGTVIQGNSLRCYYARQMGHWQDTGGGGAGTEPYTGVGVNTLAAGAPRFGGPWVTGASVPTWPASNTLPDRGSGTEATGRYNMGSLSGLQIGRNVGVSYELEILGNWFRGGNYGVNGGGNFYPGAGEYLGNFHRNRFTRDQGAQDIGGNFTHTINVDTDAEPGWNTHVDIPTVGSNRNYYMDNGAAITVRI